MAGIEEPEDGGGGGEADAGVDAGTEAVAWTGWTEDGF